MLVFWSGGSLVRNSVVLAVYLSFLAVCFFTVHELYRQHYNSILLIYDPAYWCLQ